MSGRPFVVAVAVAFTVAGQAQSDRNASGRPTLISHVVSPPIRSLPPQAHRQGPPEEKPEHHLPAHRPTGNLMDPVVQGATATPATAQTAAQWEGLGAGYSGFSMTAVPPDPNMAVGPRHIVQWVNNAFVVFDKSGNPITAPIADSNFWGFLGTCNQLGSFSDPVVQYDRAADRWIVGEVAIPAFPGFFGQFAQCFAVSTTPDPAGTYNMWAYGFGTTVPDYPKIGVWPDGYYVTWNIFPNSGATFSGPEACAWDRTGMLSGVAAPLFKCFTLPASYDSLLPSDADGDTPPPAGSPNFLMNIDSATSALNLWRFHVDFANLANSTFTGPTVVANVAAFVSPCPDSQDCVPQPGTAEHLDSMGDRLMYRLAYRNFGDHESLVANHTVVATPGAALGVRWYEVRNPAGTPTVYQQGTFAPDADNRFMASIAMDHAGNIGVGYSVSSATTFPSIRYSGWQVGDALGILQSETSLVAGGGSQTGYDRWGDYSAMRADPADDCLFWYTQEYEATTQSASWNTRIGSFRFPSCGGSSPAATTTTLQSSSPTSTFGQSVTFTATVSPAAATGTVQFLDGATPIGTASVSGGTATFATTTLAVGTHSISASYGGDAGFTGSSSSAVTQTVQRIATSTTLTSSLDPSTFGQSVTFTATVSPSTATGTVTFLDGATSLGTGTVLGGTASFATTTLAVGTHSISASYGGSTNFAGSSSAPLTQTVVAGSVSTTTAVSSSLNPSTYGQSVTFSATVSPLSGATGTVSFKDGTTVIGSGNLDANGVAVFATASLAVGSHPITAVYGGDGSHTGSTSATLTQTVNKAATQTTLTSTPNPSKSGARVTFTASVSPATAPGTVQFFDGQTSLGTANLSAGTATLQTSALAGGKHSITARYLGGANFNVSTSAVLTQSVTGRK